MNILSSSRAGVALREFLMVRVWAFVTIVLASPCLYAFAYRRKMTAGADWLAGRPEIEHFYKVNLTCLIGAVVILAVECLLFFLCCVGKNNSALKISVFVIATAIAMVTVVSFTISVVHIKSDLKNTTVSTLERYVLSENGDSRYLGFEDDGVMTQIPVDEATFGALSAGEELDSGLHSVVYDSIKSAGYKNAVEYKDKIKIEYFYYSAMLEKAELV